MISTLDNTASEIVTYQRDSTVQRKDLAQKTKDFRKLEDSAKLGEIKGLLKGSVDSRWIQFNKANIYYQHIKRLSTSSPITLSQPIRPSYKSTLPCPKPQI